MRCCWAACCALGGEFAFVVFSDAARVGLIERCRRPPGRDRRRVDGADAAAADRACRGCWPASGAAGRRGNSTRFADDQPEVLIAGFGRFGQIVGAAADCAAHSVHRARNTAPSRSTSLRRFGNRLYYGDPTRPELLRRPAREQVKVFVIAIDDPDEPACV